MPELKKRVLQTPNSILSMKGAHMKKVLSFILCILPFILFFGTCIPLLGISIAEEMGMMTEESIMGISILLLIGAILAVISVYGVMIWLIIKTVNKQDMSTTGKVVWCVCFYFLNIFVFPVYWFVYIRKE